MTPILLPKHELHSEAWHEARRSRLGGSEIAAVLGLSPWQSPFSCGTSRPG
jgi:predicted phage-related endonuclease